MWDVRFYKDGLVGLPLLFIFTFIFFFFFLHLNCGSMEIMEKKCWEVPKKYLKKSVTVFTVFEYLSNLPEWGLAGSYCKMIMLQMSFNVFLQMQIKTYECIWFGSSDWETIHQLNPLRTFFDTSTTRLTAVQALLE